MTKFTYLGFIGHVFTFEISKNVLIVNKNVLTIYSIEVFDVVTKVGSINLLYFCDI